jgi:hypothetical protein
MAIINRMILQMRSDIRGTRNAKGFDPHHGGA